MFFGWHTATNTTRFRSTAGGAAILPTAADNAFHAMIGISRASVNSSLWIDGTESTAVLPTDNVPNTDAWGVGSNQGNILVGDVLEFGLVTSDAGSIALALTSNIRNFWGF
jgi:hypothetical protein